jgi:predicted PhzF superfamily epimerase YddE/YHI9
VRIPYYEVNAFTAATFGGNPAGVCALKEWLPDARLQRIAAENNLSETAFFTKEDGFFHLRSFTPAVEVDLCGHATLAPAFVLFSELGYERETVRFQSRSGWLGAARQGDLIELELHGDTVLGGTIGPGRTFCAADFAARRRVVLPRRGRARGDRRAGGDLLPRGA